MKYKPKTNLQLLYATLIDISKSYGPGINELEFVTSIINKLGEQVHIIIPQPKWDIVINIPNVTYVKTTHGMLGYFGQQMKFYTTIRSVISNGHFNLLITRSGLLPLGLALYALAGDVPIAVKTMGEPSLKYLRQQKGLKGVVAKAIRYPHQWLSKYILSKAIAVDACTPQLVDRNHILLKINKKKIIHIENATNIDRFYPIPKEAARKKTGLIEFDPIIGYVGGKPWERGGKHMILATRELLKEYPRIGTVIIGGKGITELKKYAKNLGVLDRCILPGVIPYAEIPVWVNTFDVGIAFDLPDRVSYVGNSNQKIRQYIACGKPVIATPGGNDFLKSNFLGTIVKYNDTFGFLSALNQWLSQIEEKKREHTRKASKFAREHLSTEKALTKRLEFWSRRL